MIFFNIWTERILITYRVSLWPSISVIISVYNSVNMQYNISSSHARKINIYSIGMKNDGSQTTFYRGQFPTALKRLSYSSDRWSRNIEVTTTRGLRMKVQRKRAGGEHRIKARMKQWISSEPSDTIHSITNCTFSYGYRATNIFNVIAKCSFN